VNCQAWDIEFKKGESVDTSVRIEKVERQRLHDTVVDTLRRFIVEGVLQAGTKLNERELCERLGISRTPLREALKVLAAESLIELSPNRGASVLRLSEAEIREMFELLGGFEAMAGELACDRITVEEVQAIKSLHYEMLSCRAQNDLPGYYSRNQDIHNRIITATRNSVLQQTYLALNRRLQALRFRSNFAPNNWDSAIHDHDEMIKALEARDGKRMAVVMKKHLLDKRDAVLQLGNEQAVAQGAASSPAPTSKA
jgi:DNA-binding GntR family transcriptional regulator